MQPTPFFALLTMLATGCVGTRYLPARTTPEMHLPNAVARSTRSAEPGDVAVVIDVVDGSTRVGRVTGYRDVERSSTVNVPTSESRYEYRCDARACGSRLVLHTGTETRTSRWTEHRRLVEPLCAATPCLTSMPPGAHQLLFTSSAGEEEVRVEIGAEPTALRRALTLRESGVDLWPVTLAFWAVGACVGAIGALIATSEQSTLGPDHEPIGWGLVGGGSGLAVLGTFFVAGNRDGVVTPGASAQWTFTF